MKKTIIYSVSALIALVCAILSVVAFYRSGNGLWAIFAVLSAGLKVAAVADLIEEHQSEDFLDRFYGKGGEA